MLSIPSCSFTDLQKLICKFYVHKLKLSASLQKVDTFQDHIKHFSQPTCAKGDDKE